MIAEWITKPWDIFVDVLNLGTSIHNFTRAKANRLQHRLFAPLTAEGVSQLTTQADSDYHHAMQDDNDEEGERLAKVSMGE